MQKEGVVYYVHSDHLGSTSLTTCGSQDGCDGTPHQGVVARQLYHPYGSPRWSQGTLPTDYTFTGQRNEAGIGLMHYGARFYSPRLGRFVSADTIVPEPGEPQALNRYSYVHNSPLRYTDPSGHQGQEDCPPELTPKQLEIVQRMAEEFGIPPELLAGVLNTERVYDTEQPKDFLQDRYQDLIVFWAKAPGWTALLPPVAAAKAESYLQMHLWETYWKPGAKGVGPGIGLGHVHTGPAREVESYFADRGLSGLLPAATSSTELWETLRSEEGNIRYAAAGVRRLLEIQQGGEWEYGQITSINSLSTNDAELIMDGYWAGADTRWGTAGYTALEFQTATVPRNTMGTRMDCSYGYYQQYFAGGQ
jgi:RHS repeat-associated protein